MKILDGPRIVMLMDEKGFKKHDGGKMGKFEEVMEHQLRQDYTEFPSIVYFPNGTKIYIHAFERANEILKNLCFENPTILQADKDRPVAIRAEIIRDDDKKEKKEYYYCLIAPRIEPE